MARILIDARESGTSTGRYIDKLVEYLHKLKPEHQVVILTKSPREAYVRSIAPSFEVVVSDVKEFTFAEQLKLRKQIKALQPDLVHFGMVQQPVLLSGKNVTTMQDLTATRFKNPSKNALIFFVKQQVYKWVNKRVAHKANAILTPSEFVKNDIASFAHISPEKITVTYEAADQITDEPEPLPALENAKFIMYVGRPSPHKNLERLIEAFAVIKKENPSLKLALVGKKDALYEALEHRAQEQNVPDVIFTDFVTEGQLRWLYEHAAAYVFPSLSEGFGLPGLEAMAHDCPLVSSNATCLPEIYKGAAVYFDPTDVNDMAGKIQTVITDEEIRQSLIQTGREQVSQYSWQRMAEQTLAVYNQVVSQ